MQLLEVFLKNFTFLHFFTQPFIYPLLMLPWPRVSYMLSGSDGYMYSCGSHTSGYGVHMLALRHVHLLCSPGITPFSCGVGTHLAVVGLGNFLWCIVITDSRTATTTTDACGWCQGFNSQPCAYNAAVSVMKPFTGPTITEFVKILKKC